MGRAPETVRPLLIQVKEYERLTVRAVMEGSVEVAVAARTKNPLVGKPDLAREILAEYMSKFGAQMTLQPA